MLRQSHQIKQSAAPQDDTTRGSRRGWQDTVGRGASIGKQQVCQPVARTHSQEWLCHPNRRRGEGLCCQSPSSAREMSRQRGRRRFTARLLGVGDFAVYEGDFQILVNVDLLCAESDNFIRLADCSDDLIRSLAELHAGWRGRRLLLLLLPTATTLLLTIALAVSLIAALIVAALLLVVATVVVVIAAGVGGEELADRIFHLIRTGRFQIAFGKLEDDL